VEKGRSQGWRALEQFLHRCKVKEHRLWEGVFHGQACSLSPDYGSSCAVCNIAFHLSINQSMYSSLRERDDGCGFRLSDPRAE
jgi:hypothetical protein